MVVSRTASHHKKLNSHADSTKLVKPSSRTARLSQSPRPMSFIGTLSQTLMLRAAFASSTCLLSQIPGPSRSSDDDLLIPLIPFSRGHIRAYGLSIAAGLPCPPTPARHLMMPCSALEGGACEAGGPGPHGGFLLPGHDCFCEHGYSEKPNNLELTQPAKSLIHNKLVDKAKVRLTIFSHNLHFAARCMSLTLSNICQTATCRLF